MKRIAQIAWVTALLYSGLATAQTTTLNDLLANTEDARKVNFEAIQKQNVYSFFNLEGKYSTDLKKKVYEQTDEFQQQKARLQGIKADWQNYVWYYKMDISSYNAPQYDLNRRGFDIALASKEKMLVLSPDWDMPWNNPVGIGFKTLPVRTDRDSYYAHDYFFFKMDEQTALEVEEGSNLGCFLFFSLSSQADRSQNMPVYIADKARMVLANTKTGKIYYDRSFPENSLKITKRETMGEEKYNEWMQAEKETAKQRSEIKEKAQAAKIYDHVEVMPSFPGGDRAMMVWLSENISYPAVAAEQGIQGRVVLRFVVSPDGSIQDVNVTRSVSPECDQEAVRD